MDQRQLSVCTAVLRLGWYAIKRIWECGEHALSQFVDDNQTTLGTNRILLCNVEALGKVELVSNLAIYFEA